jgi:flagellar protein FlaF
MLTLCNFVDKRTVEIIADPKPHLVDVLVSVNRNIAAGLLADTSENSTTPVRHPAPLVAGGVSA